MEIVDIQVNLGESYFGPESDIDYYDQQARQIGITRSIIIPTLTHKIQVEDFTEVSCIWEETPGGVVYKRLIRRGDKDDVEVNPRNPYATMNRYVLSEVRRLNQSSTIKYYFIPKVHPVLDTEEEVSSLVGQPETVGLKINGLASHVTPEEVPAYIASLTRDFRKPLFVHTDWLNSDFQDSRIPQYLHHLIKGNNPCAWLDWVNRNFPYRVLLAHLARMDMQAIREVNDSESVAIGLGPDMMLQAEPMRLAQPSDNILRDALTTIDADKLLFCTDFAWNVYDRTDWSAFDWDTIERLKEVSREVGMTKQELSDILSGNAIRFFNLD